MNRERPDLNASDSKKSKFSSFDKHGVLFDKSDKPRWLVITVDVLLLLLIASAVLFVVSLFTPFSPFVLASRNDKTVTYTLELEDLDDATFAALSVGQILLDFESGATIGTVVAVDSRAYETYTANPTDDKDPELDSFLVETLTHSTHTAIVTVTLDADYEEGVGYTTDDIRIAVGRTYCIAFGEYMAQGVCVTLLG